MKKKSEIFYFGDAKNEEGHHTNLFGRSVGCMPFKYLGIPMVRRNLWRNVIERFEKKLNRWKGKLLPSGAVNTLKYGPHKFTCVQDVFLLDRSRCAKEIEHRPFKILLGR